MAEPPAPPLFRPEAVAHQRQRLTGEPLRASPWPLGAAVLVLALMAAVAVAALGSASFARRETVAGVLVPPEGVVRAAVRIDGVVERYLAAEGDAVAAGDALAVIRAASASADGDLGLRLRESLAVEARALETARDLEVERLDREAAQLEGQVALLREDVAGVERRAGLQRERLALARDEAERLGRLLGQGLATADAEGGARSAALALEDGALALEGEAAALRREAAEHEARLGAIAIDRRATEAELGGRLADVAQRRAEAQAAASQVVTAGVTGTLAVLPVPEGSAVARGETVAVVSPADEDLLAELYVPTRAAGFVEAGQEVRLLYDAFPFQRFGAGRGTVTAVTETVLAPDEAPPGAGVDEPSFRVRVALASPSIEAYGTSVRLRPGMTLSADILLERRSLLRWLLDPLHAAGRGA